MNHPVDISALKSIKATAEAARLVHFPQADGSRVPYEVFSSQEVFEREQERIYRGPTWSFVALDAEIPNAGDYKSSFVGDTPVVVTRTEDGGVTAWVNRCAHRGAIVCRNARGNATSHTCVYHQWSFDTRGNLQGVPFRRGQNGAPGMPADFHPKNHGLRQLRAESYKGLVFASFSDQAPPLAEYIGPQMAPWVDRVMHKPVVYLGCTRQYARSNWKLYYENVKDPYHASLLHLFHTTFNIFRVGMKARSIADVRHGLHSIITATKVDESDTATAYKQQAIRSMDEGFHLEDDSVLGFVSEYEEDCTNHIQTIFPQLVLQQIHNTLVARQVLPKGPGEFELVFHFFGYADDTPELRALRIKQANLVGPAGYISMEDTEATELVQRGTARDPGATSVIELGRSDPMREDTMVTENLIRKFWTGYQQLMGY
jgi:anthranilate 1,2-dioxygenase large subunit